MDINTAVKNYRNTQGTMGVERSETPLPRKQRMTLRANPYTSFTLLAQLPVKRKLVPTLTPLGKPDLFATLHPSFLYPTYRMLR